MLGISNNVLTYEKNSSINRVLLSDIRYIMSSGRKIIIKFADGGQDSFMIVWTGYMTALRIIIL